jgi:hypothetical protein
LTSRKLDGSVTGNCRSTARAKASERRIASVITAGSYCWSAVIFFVTPTVLILFATPTGLFLFATASVLIFLWLFHVLVFFLLRTG